MVTHFYHLKEGLAPRPCSLLKWWCAIPVVTSRCGQAQQFLLQGHDIKEFVFEMKVYSHADKLKQQTFLNPNRIEKIVCNGEDLFGMLPEEYPFI